MYVCMRVEPSLSSCRINYPTTAPYPLSTLLTYLPTYLHLPTYRYLRPLRPWLDKIQNEASFAHLPQHFMPLLHTIYLIWKYVCR